MAGESFFGLGPASQLRRTSRPQRRKRPLSGTGVWCRDKPSPAKEAAAVGHRRVVSRQAVPSEGSGRCRGTVVRCVNAEPSEWHPHSRRVFVREQVLFAKETLVSVVCQPSVSVRGLVAVGQRLAPVSKARTNHLLETVVIVFLPCCVRFGRNTSCGHWEAPNMHGSETFDELPTSDSQRGVPLAMRCIIVVCHAGGLEHMEPRV